MAVGGVGDQNVYIHYSCALDPVDLQWRCPVMSVAQFDQV